MVAAKTFRRHQRVTYDHWTVEVTCRYSVGGREYEGTRVGLDGVNRTHWFRGSEEGADAEAARLVRERPPVSVFCDPADPRRALPRPGVDPHEAIVNVEFGAICLVLVMVAPFLRGLFGDA